MANSAFRGHVDEFAIWSRMIPQTEVQDSQHTASNDLSSRVLYDGFRNLNNWQAVGFEDPILVTSDLKVNSRHDIEIVAPPCGLTVCDDPDVIQHYTTNRKHSQFLKTVRYR